jgi:hypothetical protein
VDDSSVRSLGVEDRVKRLGEVLTQARATIGADGELPYRTRLLIRAALAESTNDDRVAWARLSLACAAKARHFWNDAYPLDSAVYELAEEAVGVVVDGGDASAFGADHDALRMDLDNRMATATEFRPIYAGWAALSAAAAAIWGRPAVDAASELEMDVHDWDAAFFASLAVAGGATWEHGVGDANARRDFWCRFLETAGEQSGPTTVPTGSEGQP